MKIKTRELTGAALDWAVAKCEGNHITFAPDGLPSGQWEMYSSNWSVADPIIEREGINVERGNDLIFPKGNEKGEYYEPLWLASYGSGRKFHGTTPLIAAMRCYVASKLGDEVDIPDELIR